MRKKASSWEVKGGGRHRLWLGHLGPALIRGGLGSISPFAFKAFMLSLSCLVFVFSSSCLCFVPFNVEMFEVEFWTLKFLSWGS